MKSRQPIHIFEESDDELSFYDTSSQEQTCVLEDITNRKELRPRKPKMKRGGVRKCTYKLSTSDLDTGRVIRRARRSAYVDVHDDSEDELCI